MLLKPLLINNRFAHMSHIPKKNTAFSVLTNKQTTKNHKTVTSAFKQKKCCVSAVKTKNPVKKILILKESFKIENYEPS